LVALLITQTGNRGVETSVEILNKFSAIFPE